MRFMGEFISKERLHDIYVWESVAIEGLVDVSDFRRVSVYDYIIENHSIISVKLLTGKTISLNEASHRINKGVVKPVFNIVYDGKNYDGDVFSTPAGKTNFSFIGVMIEKESAIQPKKKSRFFNFSRINIKIRILIRQILTIVFLVPAFKF